MLAVPAAAQERSAAERQTLVSLGYVLGEAHALKQVCEGKTSQRWRTRMERLIALEQADAAFEKQLRNSFNAGFSFREARHPLCDAATRSAVTETARRGQGMAEQVVAASVAAAALAPAPALQ